MKHSRITRSLLLTALALFSVSCFTKKQADPYSNSNPYYGPQGAYGDNSSGAVAPAPVPDSGGYVAPAPAEPNYSAPPTSTYQAPRSSGGGGSKNHTVSKGDTLYGLARRYGTSVNAIKNANGLNSDLIRLGQKLKIP